MVRVGSGHSKARGPERRIARTSLSVQPQFDRTIVYPLGVPPIMLRFDEESSSEDEEIDWHGPMDDPLPRPWTAVTVVVDGAMDPRT